MLEGSHPWGTYQASPAGRGVWLRRTLVAYRPGTNSPERRALTFHRNWPSIGAVLAIVAMLPIGAAFTPPLAFAMVFAAYLGVFALSARATRTLRADARRLVVLSVAVEEGVTTYGDEQLLEHTVAGFEQLDLARRDGAITATQYERGWAELYEGIHAEAASDHRGSRAQRR
jgi:hypothetical protein